MNRLPLVLTILAAFIIGAAAALIVFGPPGPLSPVTDLSSTTSGTAEIGGPFTLVNQDGKTVTEADFRGRPMLVAFGYTHCPDVCPLELTRMSQALDKLGDKAAGITPVFITIDPARDTPEAMGAYVSNFHDGFVGLSGTAEQIAKAAKAFKVYYAKGETDGAGGYTMDHSAIIYLMGADGRYVTHFSLGTPPEKMAEKIRSLI